MSLPGDLTTTILTGTFTDPAGNPMRGTVTIAPNATLTDATGNVIVSQLRRVYQLFNGSFQTSPLVATDNADVNPQGFAYVVTIALQEVETYSFNILLPHSPSPVDLSALSPAVLNLPELASYLSMTGGVLTGKLTLDGFIPLQIPAGAAAGDVLTSDASGNASWSSVSADGIATAAALTAETSRAEATEGGLAASLSSEVTRAVAAEGGLASNLTSEVTRAQTAEAANATAITTETARAEAAETLALQKGNNLSDVTSASTARTNLGLTGGATASLPLVIGSGGTGATTGTGALTALGADGRYGQLATASTYTADQYFKSGHPWYDVRAFGATGNGSTDDTTAVQAALTAASGGGTVYAPPGTYSVSSVTVGSQVRLVGAGITATTFKANTASKVIDITGIQAQVSDLTVNGNTLANYGIYIEDIAYQYKLDRLNVINCQGTPGTGYANADRAYSSVVRDCFAYNNNYGGQFIKRCQETTLENCHFFNNLTGQLVVGDGVTQTVFAFRVRGGNYEGLGNAGTGQKSIYLNNVRGAVIDGVYLSGPDSTSADIYIDNTFSTGGLNTVTISGIRTDTSDACTTAVVVNTFTYLTTIGMCLDSSLTTTSISNLTTTSVICEINTRRSSGSADNLTSLMIRNASTGSIVLTTRATGDVNDRFRQVAGGTMQWGPGNAAPDLNLYRASAGVLKTDNSLTVAGTLSLTNALAIGQGGTGQTTASAALNALNGAAVAGDFGGTSASPTVAKIQGTAITAPPGGTTSFLAGNGTWVTPAGGVTLDTTVGDIQASPGTAAAGAQGLAADAKHVHPQPAMFAPSGLTGATAASRYVGATTGGAPASGTFAVGDYAVDQTGAMWVCTSAGTPGTWVCPAGDPWGVGINMNYNTPNPQVVTGAMGTANVAVYTRFFTYGYSMSSVYLGVVAASGNVCAAIYAPNTSTPGVPGARVATTGSLACPAAGVQALSLGGSVTIGRGYWVGFIADNVTATFRQLGGVNVPGAAEWIRLDTGTTFPLASGTPTTGTGNTARYPILASSA